VVGTAVPAHRQAHHEACRSTGEHPPAAANTVRAATKQDSLLLTNQERLCGVQPGYEDGSPDEQQADYGGLPDYLQPGFAPRGSGEPQRKSKLPWIIGAVAVVLIVATVAAVLAV
jgi:hypothetical protein